MVRRGRRTVLAVVVAAGGLLGSVPAAAQEPPPATVLITYGTESDATRAAAEGGAVDAADDDAEAVVGPVVVAELTPAEAAAVAADPRVVAVEPDGEMVAADFPNDPCYTAPATCPSGSLGSWHVDRVGLPAAWDLTHAEDAVVAVVDSGVQPTPIAPLAGKVLPEVDVTGGAPCAADPQADVDHGTAVAAVIAARTDDGSGIPGAAWDARVLPIRVFEQATDPKTGQPDCTALISDVIAGIGASVNRGVTVINLSLTTANPSSALEAAVRSATEARIPVVAAAGNFPGNNPQYVPQYPAAYPDAISVGATADRFDSLPAFSNRGPWVDVYAPGVSIATHGKTGAAITMHGTSFAAPIVASVVAMMRSARPGLTPADVELLLSRTADHVSGILRLDARQALLDTAFNRGTYPGIGAGVLGVGASELLVASRTNDGTTLVRTESIAESRWSSIGGLTGTDPDLASSSPGVVDAVVLGLDGAAYHQRRSGSGPWSGWSALGAGRFVTALTATALPSGGLAVFGVGRDGSMWTANLVGGQLSPWSSLGGGFTSEPDAATTPEGQIVVAAVGIDGALWAATFDQGWSGWRSLGGRLTSGPGLVAAIAGRVEVVARGVDGAVYHTAGLGGSWAGWANLGGFAAASPDLATRGGGTVDLVVRGSDSALWRRTMAGTWGAWGPVD